MPCGMCHKVGNARLRERVTATLLVLLNHPIYREKEAKRKQKKKKRGGPLRPIKNISIALKTRQSHIIEYRDSKIVPQRYRKFNKSPAVRRGSVARRSISIPMCDQMHSE